MPKTELLILTLFIPFIISCNPTVQKQDDKKVDLTVFDSTTPAIKQYHLLEWENYHGKFDTCMCNLYKDTLKLILTTFPNFREGNGLIIQYFKNKYTGFFYQSTDNNQFQFGDTLNSDAAIEVPTSDLRIDLKNKKDNFMFGDSLEGYIWATSKVYHDGGIPVKDRFEGFFSCTVKNDSVVHLR